MAGMMVDDMIDKEIGGPPETVPGIILHDDLIRFGGSGGDRMIFEDADEAMPFDIRSNVFGID